jgi:cysteinyl-tRNA synthetase
MFRGRALQRVLGWSLSHQGGAYRCARSCFSSQSSVPKPLVYNTLTKMVEPIEMLKYQNTLTWYSCGPTVYDSAHLGHARTYVCTDILRRILRTTFGIHTKLVMGLTDVDDKIIKRSGEGQPSPGNPNSNDRFLQLARQYENEFFDDLDRLNVSRPAAVARVSEHMEDIIAYVATICDNGYGYETGDGVYFSCNDLGDSYGALARSKEDVSAQDEEAGMASVRGKRDKRDFALWKKTCPDTTPGWESPWGWGRPGWHIECSAMTHSLLGDKIDVHSGGIDLQFPHHNNEVAQCQAHNNCDDWVHRFVHFGHLHIDGLKMSKSLKNFITINALLGDGLDGVDAKFAGDDFRIFCLLHHYRSNVTYSKDRIRDAAAVRKAFDHFVQDARAVIKSRRAAEDDLGDTAAKKWTGADKALFERIAEAKDQYIQAFSNDFDTPAGIKVLRAACTQTRDHLTSCNSEVPSELLADIVDWVESSLEDLGLAFVHAGGSTGVQGGESVEDVLEAFAEFRSTMRRIASQKDGVNKGELFKACDLVRDEIFPSLGYELKDGAGGQSSVRRK